MTMHGAIDETSDARAFACSLDLCWFTKRPATTGFRVLYYLLPLMVCKCKCGVLVIAGKFGFFFG